jgi:TonB-linked SusC/RagA family outer membrane protein
MKRILRSVTLTSGLILVAILVTSLSAFAQRTVTGVVKSDNEVLPGVTVLEKGTSNGTVTDSDGKFSIAVAENAVLVFSFVGMKPLEVSVGNQSSLDVNLESDVTQLGEVVVIGYGTVERRDLTSSVSSINNKQIKDIPINNAAQALTGRLAGVQVTAAEGSPDANVQIRIRGGGSITQDNSPIYIVDGMQVENALSVLSPQDIESIDVLKDAAATAIYGARGANGIVIITTKGGREQKLEVNFSAMVGFRQLANKLDVWKPYDFVNYQYERSRGNTTAQNNFLNSYGAFEDMELYKGVPFVDWQEETFGRNAMMQTYNVGVTGGGKVTQYNVSLTSNREEGVMLESDFDRKLLNFRVDNNLGKLFKVGINGRYNYTQVNGAGTADAGSSSTNRLRNAVKYKPFFAAGETADYYDPDYTIETSANSLSLVNPVLLSKQDYRHTKVNVGNINGYVSFKITDYLEFKSTIGYDQAINEVSIFNDTITSVARSTGQGQPVAQINTQRRNTINNANVLTFSSSGLKSVFGEKHNLNVMIGQEVYQTENDFDPRTSLYFPIGTTPDQAFASMGGLGTPQITVPKKSTEKLLSFFGRVTYDYNDKYLFSLSYRADGSSKFAENNRWGYFPGFSAAWRISSEPFFAGLNSKVDHLKVRFSYGASGNNRIPDFQYISLFQPGGFYSLGNDLMQGYIPNALANSDLVWEGIISRNVGFDLGLFSSRIQLSLDYYNNSSVDLLLNRVIPPTSGYTSQIQNIGETSNKGIEIQLSGAPVKRNDFSWNVNFNISFNKNTIESLGPDLTSYLQPSGWAGGNQPADYIVKVGQSVGTIWGLVTDGFYTLDDFDYESTTGVYTLKPGVASNQPITSVAPRPGVIKFADQLTVDSNGDGIPDAADGLINDSDRRVIGNASPKYFGGINNQFTYKNFDLSIFLNFQYGNDVLNANKLEFTSGYTTSSNLLSEMSGRWTNVNAAGQVVTDPTELAAMNQNATVWSPLTTASSFYVHSWGVEDASFLRINNITLGYTLPAGTLQKIKVKSLRLYATLNNLAVFTNYSGYDPEVNTRRTTPLTPGVDYSAYPRSRGYLFGLNVTF